MHPPARAAGWRSSAARSPCQTARCRAIPAATAAGCMYRTARSP
ncbi:MAG: hypothetical protein LBQ94_11800 [Treponema sp.]|nr:hypothetical protein [Treponema sp.]